MAILTGGSGYIQDWLRGDSGQAAAHVHEGLRLADRTGWVGVGRTTSTSVARKVKMCFIYENNYTYTVLILRVDGG